MSTRALISFGNTASIQEAIGVTYNHSSGYPRGLGAELYKLLHNAILGTPEETCQKLICDEPIGWSAIVHCDWTQAPCWIPLSAYPVNMDALPPQSYTARGETLDAPITLESDMWQEWLYHISLDNQTISIYECTFNGDIPTYTPVGTVNWCDPEPNWESFENQ